MLSLPVHVIPLRIYTYINFTWKIPTKQDMYVRSSIFVGDNCMHRHSTYVRSSTYLSLLYASIDSIEQAKLAVTFCGGI